MVAFGKAVCRVLSAHRVINYLRVGRLGQHEFVSWSLRNLEDQAALCLLASPAFGSISVLWPTTLSALRPRPSLSPQFLLSLV